MIRLGLAVLGIRQTSNGYRGSAWPSLVTNRHRLCNAVWLCHLLDLEGVNRMRGLGWAGPGVRQVSFEDRFRLRRALNLVDATAGTGARLGRPLLFDKRRF